MTDWNSTSLSIVQNFTNVFAEPTVVANAGPVNNTQSASIPLSGWHGGGTIGYNLQLGQVVLGVEGDISRANIDERGDCTAAFGTLGVLQGVTSSCHTNVDWFATLTSRVGVAVDHALWYVKGGLAWTHFDEDVTSAFGIGGLVGPRPLPDPLSPSAKPDSVAHSESGLNTLFGETGRASLNTTIWISAREMRHSS